MRLPQYGTFRPAIQEKEWHYPCQIPENLWYITVRQDRPYIPYSFISLFKTFLSTVISMELSNSKG